MEEIHKQVMAVLKSSKSKYVPEECLSSQLLKAAEATNPSLVGVTSLERSLVLHWLAHLELHLCHCPSIQELSSRLVTANKALRKSDFLCGFSLTIADIALFTFLKPFVSSWSHLQKEIFHFKMPECCTNIGEKIGSIFESWEGVEKRNFCVSVVAGLLFFIGWWIMIGAASVYPDPSVLNHAYHTCGVMSTVAMFMVNIISNSQLRGDTYTGGQMGSVGSRIWLFLGLMLTFGSLIGACIILFQGYIVPGILPTFPGVAVFLQNILIFFSNLLFKFGRKEDNWG